MNIRKRTLLMKPRGFTLRSVSQRCRCVHPHAWLQGRRPDGVARTAAAAAYTPALCRALARDIAKRLRSRDVLWNNPAGPRPQHHDICWTCPRCRHGVASDADHSRIPGQCKYPHARGTAVALGPRTDITVAVPPLPAPALTEPAPPPDVAEQVPPDIADPTDRLRVIEPVTPNRPGRVIALPDARPAAAPGPRR